MAGRGTPRPRPPSLALELGRAGVGSMAWPTGGAGNHAHRPGVRAPRTLAPPAAHLAHGLPVQQPD
eukprot:15127485-Alexandrium_andersonii.AAC.1